MRAVLSRGLWMLVGMWFAARVEALPAALERVQCFGLEHGLLLDAAFDVKVDPNGYPWAGGYRVMGRFDGEQFDAPDALGVAFAAIKGTHAPVFAADGSAWFSTSTSVVRWHNDALTTLSPPVPLAEVAVLAADADALWLAGTEGLYRRPNDAVASDWGKRAHAGYPLGSDRRLHVDAQQVLWLRDQGLIELRRDPRQQGVGFAPRFARRATGELGRRSAGHLVDRQSRWALASRCADPACKPSLWERPLERARRASRPTRSLVGRDCWSGPATTRAGRQLATIRYTRGLACEYGLSNQ